MKNYMSELKQVIWPKTDEVLSQFVITIIGMVSISLFLVAIDTVVVKIVQTLYK